MKISHSERLRQQRIMQSIKEHKHRQEHYEKFLARRSHNIKHKIAPSHITLDSKGFRI